MALCPVAFGNVLTKKGFRFFTGVPDSLLKPFCSYVTSQVPADHHVIAANEGVALSIASGYVVASGTYPVVYLQNSGFGNILNPHLSISHPDVYRIPALLIIGWRGEPGVKDEPQHVAQGRLQEDLLRAAEIPYRVLSKDLTAAEDDIETALSSLGSSEAGKGGPFALLVRKGTFDEYKFKSPQRDLPLVREDVIHALLAETAASDILISTTGVCSRELFEARVARNEAQRDFLTVGGMGHASSLALGVAIARPSSSRARVVVVDGDGASLMHLGAYSNIGTAGRPAAAIRHLVVNNAAHDSVGQQPTAAGDVNLSEVAVACGYHVIPSTGDPAELPGRLQQFLSGDGADGRPVFLEVQARAGFRKNLGRPTSTPAANGKAFAKHCQEAF